MLFQSLLYSKVNQLYVYIYPFFFSCLPIQFGSFPGGLDGKASAYNAEDLGSIPGLGKSPGEGNGTPLQYSCLENPMDGAAWQATVHDVAKSWTRLSDFTFTFTFPFRSPQWIEQSFLCYIVGFHQSSIINQRCIYVSSNLPIHCISSSPRSLFSRSVSISAL